MQCTETSGPGCKESIGETTLAIPGLHSTVNNDRLLWEPCGHQVDGRWRANTNTYITHSQIQQIHMYYIQKYNNALRLFATR